jgi:membrane protease YdiL (CAAX protease family)
MVVHIGRSTSARRELDAAASDPRAWPYFAWTIGLSVPFWLAGTVVDAEIAEGVPISGLMVVCPAIAASILSYRSAGRAGVSELWRRTVDVGVVPRKRWFVPAALTIPAAVAATYWIEKLVGTASSVEAVALPSLLVMSAVFLVAAVSEELGWTGFATDVLQRRRSQLVTGLVIGAVWAIWHWIPLLSAGRSAWWIAWWTVFTVASRVLIVRFYNRSGRGVPVAVVFHAMTNVATVIFADLFDPFITGVIVAGGAIVVVATGRAHADSAPV